ncbi:hypothetical protein ACLDW6_18945, partial [Acinetobacter baumannii]
DGLALKRTVPDLAKQFARAICMPNLVPPVKTVEEALAGTVAKLAMRQPFVLFKGLTFQKLCLPGAFRPGDHHN